MLLITLSLYALILILVWAVCVAQRRAVKNRVFRCYLESLEERISPANFYWAGGGTPRPTAGQGVVSGDRKFEIRDSKSEIRVSEPEKEE